MSEYNWQGKGALDVVGEMREALKTVHGEREARTMAWIAVEHVTGRGRGQLTARGKELLPGDQMDRLGEILNGLLAGRPLQYLLGETEFYGLKLKVNPSVLIPRQETEELVDWIIKTCSGKTDFSAESRSLLDHAGHLDIGTGSGCIAIALKKNLPHEGVWACDVSEAALQLARQNAEMNETTISFKQADILNEASWRSFPPFGSIVSNPPYVTEAEKKLMASNVLDYEPHLALFVENRDPLLFYRQITAFATQKLRPGGFLFFEINEAFGPQTCELLQSTGFRHIELRKDLNGKDRMIKAVK